MSNKAIAARRHDAMVGKGTPPRNRPKGLGAEA